MVVDKGPLVAGTGEALTLVLNALLLLTPKPVQLGLLLSQPVALNLLALTFKLQYFGLLAFQFFALAAQFFPLPVQPLLLRSPLALFFSPTPVIFHLPLALALTPATLHLPLLLASLLLADLVKSHDPRPALVLATRADVTTVSPVVPMMPRMGSSVVRRGMVATPAVLTMVVRRLAKRRP